MSPIRIWHVPFGELDGQRVLGQHQEIHALWALIVKKGMPWDHRWSLETYRRLLWDVHERSVAEMLQHGYTGHKTPIDLPFLVGTQVTEYCGPTEMADLQYQDRWDLVRRWNGIYRGRIPMPEAYTPVLERFAQEGCRHDPAHTEDVENKAFKGYKLCLGCKRWMTKDGINWVTRYAV